MPTPLPPPGPEIWRETRPKPKLQFDWRDWLPYLDASDASDAQKKELIETLWAIVMTFVDLGWEVRPDAESCGQDIDLTAALRAAMVHSEDQRQDEKEEA